MKLSAFRGPIAWMAKNSVASNLFMFVLLIGGLIGISRTKQEVLPEFELDLVVISVAYPGASPEEVEQGILLSLEDVITNVDGIKRVNAVASEGSGNVYVELQFDADPDQSLNDIKSVVDQITTFPEEAERPNVKLLSLRRQVISIILSGDQELSTLHEVAEKARERLRAHPDISFVSIAGVPPRELSIEIPRQNLEMYGLSLQSVSRQIAASSLELPAGGLKAKTGEILVRLSDRKKKVGDFADIVITSTKDGAEVRLGEIAKITDGYQDNDQASFFNGKPAVQVVVYRMGDETPIKVAEATKEYVKELKSTLPKTITVTAWDDSSELLRGRIDLLMDNAKVGLVLVIAILALFLDFRLAFWVAMGIPICFLGSFWLLPQTGATINMISLFAYIVTLGLVVDDAIIVGENVFEMYEREKNWKKAAIKGAKQMAVPVTFAVLTTIAAFAPLMLVPGISGKFFQLIPFVVICVLILSLIESFFILPAHLGHLKEKSPGIIRRTIDYPRKFVAKGLEWFTNKPFAKILRFCVTYRYSTLSSAVAVLLLSFGLLGGGIVKFSFFPKVEGDVIKVSARMPYGTSVEQTAEVQKIIEEIGKKTLEEAGGSKVYRGMYTTLGQGAESRQGATVGSHLVAIEVSLTPSEERTVTSNELAARWQESLPSIPGIENIQFSTDVGPGAGSPIDVQLTSTELEPLIEASTEITSTLRGYPSLRGINNSYSSGKKQLDFQLRDQARMMNLTSSDVARQMRGAFFGDEAIREQVGRQERQTKLRLPKAERMSEFDISQFRVQTQMGSYVPLEEVATFERSSAPTSITRENGIRVINISADLAPEVVSPTEVINSLQADVFPKIKEKYPDIEVNLAGQQREQAETFANLGPNYMVALFVIYALLAIPFRSYIQPFIIMSAIPFGFVGAVLGHLIMGYEMSIISMFGIVALTGVVVNDSLVLIDSTNRYHKEGKPPIEAIQMGAKRRLRPIVLTSLTTFLGLAPMILETSMQARFLIPMAISLGFGVIFATVIILLVVPSLYMIQQDVQNAIAWLYPPEKNEQA